MKKIKNIFGIMAVSMACVLTACDNWLDVQPADRVTEEQVFTSETGFWGALNGIYTELLSSDLYGGALGPEMVEIFAQRYNIQSVQKEYLQLFNYAYAEKEAKKRLQSCWEAAYHLILNCNSILENTDKHREVLDDQAYNLIRGEVIAMRAFLHFDMLRLFGPMDAPNSGEPAIPYNERVSVSATNLLTAPEVLTKVAADLEQAARLLKEWDPVIEKGPRMLTADEDKEENRDPNEPGNAYRFRGLRMNYYAVVALQARVALYAGHKTEALAYARQLIDDTQRQKHFPFVSFTDVSSEQNMDRMFSSEVLFSMFNDKRDNVFKTYFDSDNASSLYKLMPRKGAVEELFGQDEKTSDYRYKWWKTSTVAGETDLLMNIKYKGITNTDLLHGKLMALVRLSEMYLIAAECETDETQAFAWLNAFRRQRGLARELSDDLEANLQKEYDKEFLGEGQLFFYYKRKGVKTLPLGTSGKNREMTAAAYVPPLPESESNYRK